MTATRLCVDCRTLMGSSILNEPHVSLETYVVSELAAGTIEYYECRACGAKLSRERRNYNYDGRWQLVV
ncbi:MAG TPA: hypothetical protein VGK37_15635 [Casimicrobiaceae bacterium]